MASKGIISDLQKLEYTSDEAGATVVDLSCWVTEPPEDAVEFETIDQPVLCAPQQSSVHVGARTLTMTLLWGPDWETEVAPLFGTSGDLDWHIDGETGAGYTYTVQWPSTHGLAAPFGESVVVEVQLGVSDRVPLAAA